MDDRESSRLLGLIHQELQLLTQGMGIGNEHLQKIRGELDHHAWDHRPPYTDHNQAPPPTTGATILVLLDAVRALGDRLSKVESVLEQIRNNTSPYR